MAHLSWRQDAGHNDIRQNDTEHYGLICATQQKILCHYAKCYYTVCCIFLMLNIIMLSVVIMRVVSWRLWDCFL